MQTHQRTFSYSTRRAALVPRSSASVALAPRSTSARRRSSARKRLSKPAGSVESAKRVDDREGSQGALGAFEDQLTTVVEVLERQCRMRLRSEEEREEFPAWAMIRLIERWPKLVRDFQARARFTSYLDRVVENLVRDYRIEKWGKWRPSQCARRLGLQALELERLVYRDRWEPKEAVETMVFQSRLPSARSEEVMRERLWSVLADLPRREPIPVALDPDLIANWFADSRALDFQEENDLRASHARLLRLLVRALGELDEASRTLLESYFVHGTPYVEVAAEEGRDRTEVYNQAHKSLRRMRRLFEREGVERRELGRLLEGVDLGRPLEWAFAAARCPRGRAWAARAIAVT